MRDPIRGSLRLIGAIAIVLSLSPASAQERTVNFYNWSNYVAPGVLEDFTKETGIKVVYDTFDANETLETRLLAGKSGYDVVVPTGYFLQRQITAKVFLKLDKSKLPNLANAWPVVTRQLATYDPGNDYGANYMWGTTGIGYNVKKVAAAMKNAPVDSWKLVFDPAVVKNFKKCGIAVLDSATEMYSMTLSALGKDPNSQKPEDLEAATKALMELRPNVRYADTQRMIGDLANGEICVAIGYNGDILQARDRAAKAAQKRDIAYGLPKEGAMLWIDTAAIPKDAPNPDGAHRFLDFMMEPKVAAASSTLTPPPRTWSSYGWT